MTSPQQLRQHFNYYIYSSSMGTTQLKDALNSSKLTEQFSMSPLIYERRQHRNREIKQQMRLNGERFAEGYRILKRNPNFELLYKEIDYSLQISSFSLNTQAFLVTIQFVGTKQQVQYWRSQVFAGRIIGAYGQTQLGHGSNVQLLETEAHYDDRNGDWIINSPRITSVKFWPGLLGTYATHCVLQSKTFVRGKSIGIQTFVLQLRDKNLQCLEGIQAGDIGAKLGFGRVDNGYLKINNVRVPRTNMLMKYIKVEPDGTVLGLQNKQAIKYAYGSMLNLRVRLTNGFALVGTCLSSANLYTIHMKQGLQNIQDNKKMLIQHLCLGFGFVLVNNHTITLFNNFLRELKKQNYNDADNWLILCHIVSSTLKALSSWKAIRTSCLNLTSTPTSSFNITGLPFTFTQYVPSSTYQGDNSVLLQQTAKYMLMKQVQDADKQYIKPQSQINSSDIQACYQVLEYVTALEVKRLQLLFEKETESGVPFNTFWNEKYQKQIIQTAKLWGVKTAINGLIITLNKITQYKDFYTKIAKVYTSMMLQDVFQLSFYGFNIKNNEDWKTFTEAQFETITNIDFPLKRGDKFKDQLKDIKLIERNKQWMRSRL